MKYLILIMIIVTVGCCGPASSKGKSGKYSKSKDSDLVEVAKNITPSLIGCGSIEIVSASKSNVEMRGRFYSSDIRVVAWKVKSKCDFKTYYCSVVIMVGQEKGGISVPTCTEHKEI